MRFSTVLLLVILMSLVTTGVGQAQVRIDGFLQGLFGGSTDRGNPTATEYTASETRLQLRAEHFGDDVEFFGRLDFLYDGSISNDYDWELREGYAKFRLGRNFDFKIGRQILTWGTGDLIFINDVFAKDYRSFFLGRDDQYLKAPQSAIRAEWYSGLGSLSLVWTPRFEPNRLPIGERLSYFNPFTGSIVGTGLGEEFLFDAPLPEASFNNSELALRFSRTLAGFTTSLYYYRGFYKNPVGGNIVAMVGPMPVIEPSYPRLHVYGASIRGMVAGGVFWAEGGYLDSRDDPDGTNHFRPNSSITGLAGFERQIATNLTANIQWQVDHILDYDLFLPSVQPGAHVRDENRHLLTSRVTKLLWDENLTLSSFVFYSPTDEDVYYRFSAAYKHTDELTLAVGGNIFAGENQATDFGQFQKNDNFYFKVTYGF